MSMKRKLVAVTAISGIATAASFAVVGTAVAGEPREITRAQTVTQPQAQSTPEAQSPLGVSHRGGAGEAPENTAAAMAYAADVGTEYTEIDIQLSSDDVPVLMHDETLERTTNVSEVFPDRVDDPVGSFTYDELTELDAGSWFGEEFAGEQIPQLSDVLEYVDASGPGLFLELKDPASSPGVEDVVAEELAGDDWQEIIAAGQLQFLSFDAESLQTITEQVPDAPLMWLNAEVPGEEELAEVAGWADALGSSYTEVDADDVTRAQDAGLTFGVYTVDDSDDICTMIQNGVDVVTTDYPERLLESREDPECQP